MPKKYKSALLREQYEEPVCLMRDEFFKVLNTDVPEALQETKDAFVLQCAFGARISDFSALSMPMLLLMIVAFHTFTIYRKRQKGPIRVALKQLRPL